MQEIVLEVSPSVLPAWRELPRCVRWRVGGFPLSSAEGDVAAVATCLATAFSQLVRRITAIVMDGSITIRVACEGVHDGMWGDIIRPTRRRVTFEEQHEIVAVDGRVVSDQIALDLPAIVSQLRNNRGVDPDETARMGRARRELHARARR